jgi:hypothetical protein
MKRLATLLFAVAFTFAMVAPAGAIEVNVKGTFQFATALYNSGAKDFNENKSTEHFQARTRVRTVIDFIADENTKGVLYLSTETIEWGSDKDGGSLDTTKNTMKTREAYLDWSVPDTGLRLKVGLQAAGFPGAISTPIYNGEAAGITASYTFNDQVSATLGWFRISNEATNRHDAVDMFALIVPIKVAGGSVTPYGNYTFAGKDASIISGNGSYIAAAPGLDSGEAWHVGLAVDIPVTADLTIKADAIYGAFDVGGQGTTMESSGYFLDAKVLYNLGFAKVGLLGWYSSGTDDDDYEDGDFGYMPSYVTGSLDNGGFGPSSLGFFGGGALNNNFVFGANGIATWGIGLSLEDISFVADLSHTARILYYRGTDESPGNSNARVPGGFNFFGGGAGGGILSEDDSAWEFNFDTTYKISKYLTAQVNLGLIVVDWDDKAGRAYYDISKENHPLTSSSRVAGHDMRDTAYKASIGLYYNF